MEKKPATRDQLLERLRTLAIDVNTVDHPPLFTVEESRSLRGEIPGVHSKNLFLKCKKGALWLVVAQESATINLKRLHATIGSGRLSFGKPDLLLEVLGVPPGSVTPFALINDTDLRVSVILDADMMAHELLNFHPLVNNATTAIARDDLLKFIADCGHEPAILPVNDTMPDTAMAP